MDRNTLQERTKMFHINVIHLCSLLPKTVAGFEIAKQLIRSAGSVGANYRATKRAKSPNDFVNKIKIIVEEADESLYWLEIINDTKMVQTELLYQLKTEANELTAIFVSSLKTMSQQKPRS